MPKASITPASAHLLGIYAGLAMQGLVSKQGSEVVSPETIAQRAFSIASAMMSFHDEVVGNDNLDQNTDQDAGQETQDFMDKVHQQD